MAPIIVSTEVARAPEQAFAYVTDPTRFVEWQEGVLSGRIDGDEPPRAGDRCLTTRRMGRGERQVTAVVTHIDPPRTWGVRGIDGPLRATVNVTVDPLGQGGQSRVTIALDFRGHGLGRLLVPLVVRGARKEMPANVRRLKQRLEGQRSNGSTQ